MSINGEFVGLMFFLQYEKHTRPYTVLMLHQIFLSVKSWINYNIKLSQTFLLLRPFMLTQKLLSFSIHSLIIAKICNKIFHVLLNIHFHIVTISYDGILHIGSGPQKIFCHKHIFDYYLIGTK